MRDQREVVCAILDSEASHGAAHLAARLAERLSLGLALVHVQVPVPPPDAAVLEGPHPIAPRALTVPQAPGALDRPAPEPAEWEQVLVSEQPVRRDTIIGRPAEALQRLSDAPHTSVLVVVDAGGGPLASKLSGNAARDLARHAGCPVVLVAPGPLRDHANVRNILCGVDEDDATSAVAAQAGTLAGSLGGRLRFIHVRPRAISGAAPEPVRLDAIDDDGDRAVADAVFAVARAAIAADVVADYAIVRGDVADGLRAAADAMDAGLIVIGEPQYGVLGSALLGSAAHDLLRESGRPVLIVPRAGHADGTRAA